MNRSKNKQLQKKVRKKEEWRLDTFDVMIPTLMSKNAERRIQFRLSLDRRTATVLLLLKMNMNAPSSEHNLN